MRVSETTLFGDMECFRVETPAATYLFGKRGAGFASIIDPAGHDWISYKHGGLALGEYRGLPKCGQPIKYFHCGYGFGQYANDNWFTSIVAAKEAAHLRIHSETKNGDASGDWDFFPTYATFTLTRCGNEGFWFLYEGTPDGELKPEEDFALRPGGKRTPLSEPWAEVTPWVAFGAKNAQYALVCINHQNDSPVDSYVAWPYKAGPDGGLNQMAVFGFGRPGWTDPKQHTPQMQTFPARFTDRPDARRGSRRHGRTPPLFRNKNPMSRLSFLLALLAAASLRAEPLPSVAPEEAGFDPARLAVMHSTLDRMLQDGQEAGAITLLARGGKIADFYTNGYRDLEKKLPMQRDTICRIYSMSKIVTAVGVMTLLEDGRFNLDDPIADYLPELKDLQVMTGGTADAPRFEPPKTQVTIQHLLTHTSGFGYDFDGADAVHQIYQRADLWSGPGLDAFVKKAGKLPLHTQPGEAFTYGINFDVLGALIERVSHQSFGDFLQSRIFGPLGMKDTAFHVPPEKLNRLAKTYKHGPDGKLVEAEPILGVHPEPRRTLQSGGGGLFSTADDYARFAQMLLNGGTLDGCRVLGRKTVELMSADHVSTLSHPPETVSVGKGFGYGVEVTTHIGHGSIPASEGQYGWYGAANTYCQIDPHEHLIAIAFTQDFPFNGHKFFSKFATGYYQALK